MSYSVKSIAGRFKMRPVFLERKFIILACVVVAVSFILGIIIGYFGSGSKATKDTLMEKLLADQFDHDFVKRAQSKLDPQQIRSYHEFLTKEPHIAGLKRDIELTNWIRKTWEEQGLDKVTEASYDFYLSWPDSDNPNKIHLIDESGKVQFTSKHK